MIPLNKIYNEKDVEDHVLAQWIIELKGMEDILRTAGLAPAIPHPARYWEYAQALRAPGQVPKTVLEIGGSDSILMPTMMTTHYTVEPDGKTQYPSYTSVELIEFVDQHANRRTAQCPQPLRQLMALPDEQFDLVMAISVIEHIEDPLAAMAQWLERVAPGGTLFLTSDIGDQERDYYMFHWMRSMKLHGQRVIWDPMTWPTLGYHIDFDFIGPQDWTWNGGNVNGYSFASMALRRIRDIHDL